MKNIFIGDYKDSRDVKKAWKTIISGYSFVLAIYLELIVMMTDHYSSWTIPFRGRITHIAFVLFVIKILLTDYSVNDRIIICILVILGGVSYFTCKDEYMIRCVAMVAASKSVDIIYILKRVLMITIIGTIVIVFLSFVGVGGAVYDVRDFGRGMLERRYCFGFNHANNIHDIYWYIVSIYIYIHIREITWKHCLFLTILNVILYSFTVSRTGFLVVELIVISVFVIRYVSFFRNKFIWLFTGIIAVISVVFLTILGSAFNVGNNRLVEYIDPFLNGRMEMLSEYANISEWMLFPPSRIAENIDNGFSKIIYTYGIVWGIVTIGIIVYMFFCFYKKNEVINSVLLLGTVLVFFMEATFVINVSLLCNMLIIVAMCGINDNKFGVDLDMF